MCVVISPFQSRLADALHANEGEPVSKRPHTLAGPMYEKYNAVLRFFSGHESYESLDVAHSHFLQKKCETLCLGAWTLHPDGSLKVQWKWHNKYCTTIHAINSCVLNWVLASL